MNSGLHQTAVAATVKAVVTTMIRLRFDGRSFDCFSTSNRNRIDISHGIVVVSTAE